nr:hypothetical protein [Tanacetum cinerariifolium]
MDNTRPQQKTMDDELVAPANCLKIEKSNLRLSSNLKSKESTLQVALDALKVTIFYNAFVISAHVPKIYMQEFWVTVSRHHSSLCFKLNGKSHIVNVDNFRDMLKICPKLPGQIFEEPPLEEVIKSFLRDLGHTGEIKFLFDVNVNHMHQPWRSLAAIINKCLSRKTNALETLRLSLENKNSKKNNDMYYPRFTKVIVDYFMAKDQALPRRNKMFWHNARDEFMFTTSEPYMTYHTYATGEKTLKTKSIKKKADSESSPKTKPTKILKMNEAVKVAVQLQSNKLKEEAQVVNDEFLKQIDSNINAIIKDQVKAQVSKILPTVEKYVTESLSAELLTRSSNQPQTSYTAATSLSEFELKKILIDKIKENKSMHRSDVQKNLYNALIELFDHRLKALEDNFSKFKQTNQFAEAISLIPDKDIFVSYGDVVTLKRGRNDQDNDKEPSAGSNRGTKRRRSGKEESSKEATQKESKLTSSSKEAVDSGHVQWIEDKVPRSIWSPSQVVYDKQAYWRTYHWGSKRQKFYGYSTNMETSNDVFSRHRIIVVTSDFKRLHRQDIEDMLLLLVQGKLTNLNFDERFVLNVALKMYTRRIVIQECMEDLQVVVESYQKKINLSKPDSYRLDLRKMTPYTAYHDIQGIIYQDDMNKNCLICIDELHKFSDDTLNHVRTALSDIATGI